MSRSGSAVTDCPCFLCSHSVRLFGGTCLNMKSTSPGTTIVCHVVVSANFLLRQRRVSCDMVTDLTAINQTALNTSLVGSLGLILSYHVEAVLPQEVVVPSSGFSLLLYFRKPESRFIHCQTIFELDYIHLHL